MSGENSQGDALNILNLLGLDNPEGVAGFTNSAIRTFQDTALEVYNKIQAGPAVFGDYGDVVKGVRIGGGIVASSFITYFSLKDVDSLSDVQKYVISASLAVGGEVAQATATARLAAVMVGVLGVAEAGPAIIAVAAIGGFIAATVGTNALQNLIVELSKDGLTPEQRVEIVNKEFAKVAEKISDYPSLGLPDDNPAAIAYNNLVTGSNSPNQSGADQEQSIPPKLVSEEPFGPPIPPKLVSEEPFGPPIPSPAPQNTGTKGLPPPAALDFGEVPLPPPAPLDFGDDRLPQEPVDLTDDQDPWNSPTQPEPPTTLTNDQDPWNSPTQPEPEKPGTSTPRAIPKEVPFTEQLGYALGVTLVSLIDTGSPLADTIIHTVLTPGASAVMTTLISSFQENGQGWASLGDAVSSAYSKLGLGTSLGGALGGMWGAQAFGNIFKGLGIDPRLGSAIGSTLGSMAGQDIATLLLTDGKNIANNGLLSGLADLTGLNFGDVIGSSGASAAVDAASSSLGEGLSSAMPYANAIISVGKLLMSGDFSPANIASTAISVALAFSPFAWAAPIVNALFSMVQVNTEPTAWSSVNVQDNYWRYADNAKGRRGGSAEIAEAMGVQATTVLNSLLAQMGGVMVGTAEFGTIRAGYEGKEYYVYTEGGAEGTGGGARRGTMHEAVEEGVLDILRNTKLDGGDVLAKRALQRSAARTLEGISLDLGVAQAYGSYLLNKGAIDAAMAADPNSLQTESWQLVLQQAATLRLDEPLPSEADRYYSYNGLSLTHAMVALDLDGDGIHPTEIAPAVLHHTETIVHAHPEGDWSDNFDRAVWTDNPVDAEHVTAQYDVEVTIPHPEQPVVEIHHVVQEAGRSFAKAGEADVDGDGKLNRVSTLGAGDAVLLDTRKSGYGASNFADRFSDSSLDGLVRAFDGNGDGVIDGKDKDFASLAAWRDLDQDGQVDSGEISSLKDLGIDRLDFTLKHSTTELTEADSATVELDGQGRKVDFADIRLGYDVRAVDDTSLNGTLMTNPLGVQRSGSERNDGIPQRLKDPAHGGGAGSQTLTSGTGRARTNIVCVQSFSRPCRAMQRQKMRLLRAA